MSAGPSVYVIANGPLGMSQGKLAAQTFQACQRLLDQANFDPDLAERLSAWRTHGTRTIVREAQTCNVFDRIQREVPGIGMVDEGMNEVPPGSLTSWASIPLWPDERPQVLNHKRVPLLTR